jgi:ankyrin repeat protein
LPGLDRKVHEQLMAEIKKDPKWATVDPDPKTVRELDAVFLFDGQLDGPVATIAAQCGDLATLDVALDHHADLKARAPHSNDVMTMAVMADNPAIVKRLLDHGADPSSAPDESADGLITAIVQGNTTMVKLLLDHGADPCAENRSRQRKHNDYQAKHPGQLRPLVSDAKIARRKNLPDDLVARLACPEFDTASEGSH